MDVDRIVGVVHLLKSFDIYEVGSSFLLRKSCILIGCFVLN